MSEICLRCGELLSCPNCHYGWVSVDDELPPPDKEDKNRTSIVVWINYTYVGADGKKQQEQRDAYYFYERNEWYDADTNIFLGYNITHWMLLPEEPEV